MFFVQFNSCQKECQARLCWYAKKKVGGSFNLQELAGKVLETAAYQLWKRKKWDTMGEEALQPVPAVAPEDRFDVIFIHGEMPVQESGKAVVFRRTEQDGGCVVKEDLGIRDHAGKHEGMGGPAFPASEPAYAQTEL